MTAPTTALAGLVGFVQLADECRVIKTSPAWSEVKPALDWIEESRRANRAIDLSDERLDHVGGFAKLLRASAGLIANALVCGAAIGASRSGTTRGDRIHAGLRAISRGFRFENLGEAETNHALSRVRQLVTARFPALAAWATLPSADLGSNRDALNQWTLEVATRLQFIDETLANAALDIPALESESWEDLRRRIGPSFPRSPVVEPTFAELACVAADIPPSANIRFDPARVTVAEWSALATSVVDTPPATPTLALAARTPQWVAPLALHANGFRMSPDTVVRLLTHWGNLPVVALAGAKDWPWILSGRPPRLAALILKLPTNSTVDTWSPTEEAALFAVTSDVAKRIVTVPVKTPADDTGVVWIALRSSTATLPLPLTHVVIEMSATSTPPAENPAEEVAGTLRAAGLRVVRLYGQPPTPRGSIDTTIVADSADQFVRQLLRSVTSMA